jgi:hypothetical protein
MGKDSDVPQPGPARLAKGAGPDEWLEQAKQCKYLPEADMKRLCEIVKECLMEGKAPASKVVARQNTVQLAGQCVERPTLKRYKHPNIEPQSPTSSQ